jgi:hypothetical protein
VTEQMPELEPQRHGLYYPYFHVRDQRWLKAAALYWPKIVWIVPVGYQTRDSAAVRALAGHFIERLPPGDSVVAVAPRFLDTKTVRGREKVPAELPITKFTPTMTEIDGSTRIAVRAGPPRSYRAGRCSTGRTRGLIRSRCPPRTAGMPSAVSGRSQVRGLARVSAGVKTMLCMGAISARRAASAETAWPSGEAKAARRSSIEPHSSSAIT